MIDEPGSSAPTAAPNPLGASPLGAGSLGVGSLGADLLAAGALSAALHFAWPGLAPADDPLRGSLVLLPLALAGLRWSDRHTGLRSTAWEPIAISLAVIVVLLRSRFGWLAFDAPLAAALFATLGTAIGRRILHLWHTDSVPATSAASGQRSMVFFVLPLVVYLLIQPWALTQRAADGDEPYYLLLAHSLVEDGDLDLRDDYADGAWRTFATRPVGPQPGDPVSSSGAVHSRHDPLLPALLAPGVALGGRAGAAATMALLAALLAWATHDLARRRWPAAPRGAVAAWALFAFTPPLLVYAHQLWVEVPAALCLVVALGRLARWSPKRRSPKPVRSQPGSRDRTLEDSPGEDLPTVRDVLAFVVPVALLPLLKMRFLLVAAPLLALGAWRLSQRTRAFAEASVGKPQPAPRRLTLWLPMMLPVLAAIVLAAWNTGVSGRLLKLNRAGELDVMASGLGAYLRGAVGMFWDGAFGLFPTAPIWLLLLPAVAWTMRFGGRWRTDLLWLTLPTLVALAPRLEWFGGWSPPFRYPLVLLPLFAVTLAPLLDRPTAAWRTVSAALGGATAVLTAAWIAVPGWTYSLADGASDLAHAAGRLLGADVVSLLPSTVTPRPATWFWVAGSLGLAAWLAARAPNPSRLDRARDHHGVLACAALLGLLGLGPGIAERLPTRVAEVESAWIHKSGGELTPDRWIVARPRFRGGWLLPSGSYLDIPVVADGNRVALRLVASRRSALPPDRLAIWRIPAPPAGGAPAAHAAEPVLLDTWIVPAGEWTEHEVATVDWAPGDVLRLTSPQPSRMERFGVIVDRVEFSWSTEPSEARRR